MSEGLATTWDLFLNEDITLERVRTWIREESVNIHYQLPKCGTIFLFVFFRYKISQWKEICLLLLEHGCNINHANFRGATALTLAAQFGTFEQVQFLVDRGAKISHTNSAGVSPLMFACSNTEYQQIIPFLIGKGASLHICDVENRKPFDWAYQHGSAVLECILPYYSNDMQKLQKKKKVFFTSRCCDPLCCFLALAATGYIDKKTEIAVSDQKSSEDVWLHCFLSYNGLSSSDLPFTSIEWRYSIGHFGSRRYVKVDEGTLLHAACAANNLEAVQMIIRRNSVNPYLLNKYFLSAEALTSDPMIASLVQGYRMFRPTLQYVDWLGPYFVKKARALLLVNQRLRLFPKDIIIYILGWISHLNLY